MSNSEFCDRAAAVLGDRGWKTRLSVATGKDYATVKRWASGSLEVPAYAIAILELLEIVPARKRPERFSTEFRRPVKSAGTKRPRHRAASTTA